MSEMNAKPLDAGTLSADSAGMQPAGQEQDATGGGGKPLNKFQQLFENLMGGKDAEAEKDGAADAAKDGKESGPESFSEAQVEERIRAERKKWEAAQQAQTAAKEKPGEGEPDLKAEIEQLKADSLRKDLTAKAAARLGTDGYPNGLAELMDFGSEDKFTASYAKVTDTFTACLQEAVKERLKGKTPEGLGGSSAKSSAALTAEIAANIRGK